MAEFWHLRTYHLVFKDGKQVYQPGDSIYLNAAHIVSIKENHQDGLALIETVDERAFIVEHKPLLAQLAGAQSRKTE